MNTSRRGILKAVLPLAATSAIASGLSYLMLKGGARPVNKNDLNKPLSDATLPLSGKKVVCLGDSITGSYNYPAKMQQMTGGEIINLGLGGSTLSRSTVGFDSLALYNLASSINTGDWSTVINAGEYLYSGDQHLDFRETIRKLSLTQWDKVDYLVLFYGTNDYGNNFKIGEKNTFDTDSVVGALNYSIKMILSKLPEINILVVTPMYRSRFNGGDEREADEHPNDNGNYLAEYVNAIIETSGANKIPCIDMLRSSGINRYNAKHMLADGLHPSEPGEVRLAQRIAAAITSTFY